MEIGCGCVNLGSASSGNTWRDDVQLVRDAIESGITLFDTADAYGSGSSERVLGRAIRGRRGSVVLSTKGGYVFRSRSRLEQAARATVGGFVTNRREQTPASTGAGSKGGYVRQDFSPARLRQAVHGSLRRLGTDYLDVYHLHGPDRILDDATAELIDLRDAGTIRRFGVGAESVATAASWQACVGPDVIQFPFGVLDPDAERMLFPNTDPAVCELWARGVLGGGLISAAMRSRDAVIEHPKSTLIERLASIAHQAGMQLDELAFRWVGGHRHVHAILVGISSADHLVRNQHLASLPSLPEDVVAAITEAQADARTTDAPR